MSNQGELKSVTVLDITIFFKGVAILKNLNSGVWRKLFATKMFIDKRFEGMLWPCFFDINGYRFCIAANQL